MSYFAVIREAGPGRPARTAVSRIDLPAGGPAGSLASRRARIPGRLPRGTARGQLPGPACGARRVTPGGATG